jgi:hypothetical protein
VALSFPVALASFPPHFRDGGPSIHQWNREAVFMADSRREGLQSGLVPSDVVAVEALRNASNPPPLASEAKDDKGIPLVWRIFGGTVLSIAAMVAVTLYQQLHTKVETLSDTLVKKEEFFSHRKGVWDRFSEMQKQGDAVDTELKQRCARLEEQVKINEQLRQEIIPEVKQMRELLLAHFKDGSMKMEQQVKAGDLDRKKLLDEVHQLQERLARMESRMTPSDVKSAVYEKKE